MRCEIGCHGSMSRRSETSRLMRPRIAPTESPTRAESASSATVPIASTTQTDISATLSAFPDDFLSLSHQGIPTEATDPSGTREGLDGPSRRIIRVL